MNNTYSYFISFHYTSGIDTGFGNTMVNVPRKIHGAEEIARVQEQLVKQMPANPNNAVVILHFILMKEPSPIIA